jgi:hypothetical protein
MTTLRSIKSVNRLPLRLGLFLIPLVFVCIGLLPEAEAVVPPPGGGYPNFTTAAGDHALQALTSGLGNTAIGTFSLFSVTTGNFNTAVGAGALDLNTADLNTATGAAALLFNTTGTENTANGAAALEFNDSGSHNTAIGAFALFSNTEGDFNTANGAGALSYNTRGEGNTAIGSSALNNNSVGLDNTAIGADALFHNTTSNANTAIGSGALLNNTTGFGNIAIGSNAGFGVTTASNVICIGSGGNDVENSCYIGNIFGSTSSNGVAVLVNSNGRLGTMTSSARFKDEIKPMGSISEALFALKPVAFRYKKEIDPARTPQLGVVAEDVEKVNPDLVVRDKEGKPYSVRYDAVNAMLLNEFLKEHRKVQEQGARITQLNKDFRTTVTQLTARLDGQAAQIQKVSAQLEASKPVRQVVNNR